MNIEREILNFKNYFHSKEQRRQTFTSWVFEDNVRCNADALAEAGFIYAGNEREPDCAQCFVCKKSLDGWEPEDDPWSEHLKHQKDCPFAKTQEPQLKWTVEQYIKVETDCLIRIINLLRDQHIKNNSDDFKRIQA